MVLRAEIEHSSTAHAGPSPAGSSSQARSGEERPDASDPHVSMLGVAPSVAQDL